MLRIDVGVQEADRDCLYPFRRQHPRSLGDVVALQRHLHFAGAQEPLLDFARKVARHQRTVTMKEEIVGFGTVAAADDVDVAGAARDDEAGLCALSLDQCVDGDGRAVDELVDGGGGKGALADAIDDALPQLSRSGQAFCLYEASGRVIEPDQISESPSDIDRNNNHAIRPRVGCSPP